MGELVLHIGNSKTGTTSLQHFFHDNRELLGESGIHYPTTWGTTSYSRESRCGNFLQRYCFAIAKGKDPRNKIENVDRNLEIITESLNNSERTLLSEESFFALSPKTRNKQFIRSIFCGRCALKWKTIAKAMHEIGADNMTAILYLRRQDDAVVSRWGQSIKTENCCLPFKKYCMSWHSLDYCDYYKQIEIMMQELSKKTHINLVVRRYDRSLFYGGNIYSDFCKAASIDWREDFIIPENEYNTSLTFDVSEAIRLLRKENEKIPASKLLKTAQELSRNYPDPPGMTPFTRQQADVFMSFFERGNNKIAKKYLGEDKLFSEDSKPRPFWIPDAEKIQEFKDILSSACC